MLFVTCTSPTQRRHRWRLEKHESTALEQDGRERLQTLCLDHAPLRHGEDFRGYTRTSHPTRPTVVEDEMLHTARHVLRLDTACLRIDHVVGQEGVLALILEAGNRDSWASGSHVVRAYRANGYSLATVPWHPREIYSWAKHHC